MVHWLDGVLWLLVAAGVTRLAWEYRDRLLSRRSNLPGDAAYYRGLFYDNPNDRRLIVPPPFGIGWTVNLAHPASARLLVLMFGLPLAVTVLITILHG